MLLCDCFIRPGGDVRNAIPKTGLSIAEIAVLVRLHGKEGVIKIRPTGKDRRNPRDELRRLRGIYAENDERGEKAKMIAELWGEYQGFPKKWADLDLPDSSFARADEPLFDAETREQAHRRARKELLDPMAVEAVQPKAHDTRFTAETAVYARAEEAEEDAEDAGEGSEEAA